MEIIRISATGNTAAVAAESCETPHTFYGALHKMCRGLLNKYPGKPVVFATPIKRRLSDSYKNPESGITPFVEEQKALYFMERDDGTFDGTHPNTAGHAALARRVTAGIRSIVGM